MLNEIDKKINIELSETELKYLVTALRIAEAKTAKSTYNHISKNFPEQLEKIIQKTFSDRNEIVKSIENLYLFFITKDKELTQISHIKRSIEELFIPKDIFVEFVEDLFVHKVTFEGPKLLGQIQLSFKMRETLAHYAAEFYNIRINNCIKYYVECLKKKPSAAAYRVIQNNFIYVKEVKDDKSLTFLLAQIKHNDIQELIATQSKIEYLPYLFAIDSIAARKIIQTRLQNEMVKN